MTSVSSFLVATRFWNVYGLWLNRSTSLTASSRRTIRTATKCLMLGLVFFLDLVAEIIQYVQNEIQLIAMIMAIMRIVVV